MRSIVYLLLAKMLAFMLNVPCKSEIFLLFDPKKALQ
jgi:hypothetical protein